MKFNKSIEYRRKNGFTDVVHCKGVKGFILYKLIRFVNWMERKVDE